MMRLIKRASRPPTTGCAIDQGGVWLVDDDCAGTAATRVQVDAVTIPHPAGAGRRMLRQVPAGVTLIEVVDGRPAAATAAKDPRPLEDVRVR